MNKFDGERLGKTLANLKKAWSSGICLHPLAPTDCSGKPIDSHTVQKSRVLESIAVDSHVLRFRPNAVALLKSAIAQAASGQPPLSYPDALKATGAFAPERIGLSDASVFPGFCGKHDHDTFAPIEECELVFDDEQCFLLTYRPACMELWAQKSKAQNLKAELDQEEYEPFLQPMLEQVDIAVSEHMPRKAELDIILQSQDFSTIHALVFEFDANPGVATAGVLAPEVDFDDNLSQLIDDVETPLQYVSYSILPSETGGYAVISWHGKNAVAEKFVASLLSLDSTEWPDALLRVAFESIENTFFSPKWWDSLSQEKREWVSQRAVLGATENQPPSYKPDGIRLAAFNASIKKAK